MKNLTIPVLALTVALVTPFVAQAQSPSASAMSSSAPDNSKSNKTDASNTTTAQSQSNNATDVQITKRIRQSLIADKSLSTYAHNVKIVTVGGMVTLNGVVKSDEEKSAVEMKATAVAGADKVKDTLKIAP